MGPKALEIFRSAIAGSRELPRFAFQQIKAGGSDETFWPEAPATPVWKTARSSFGPAQTIKARWEKQLRRVCDALGLRPCGSGRSRHIRLEMGYRFMEMN
jgi:glycine cleavage system aminomethyltransferase T